MNEKKLVHVERIAIRWGDMDAMGHVNNTVYFRYMEQARIAWFESLVPRAEAWGEISIVIVNASCNFRRPINYPGTVEVKVFAGGAGRVERAHVLRIAPGKRNLRRRRRDRGVPRARPAAAAHPRPDPRGNRRNEAMTPLWTPSAERAARTELARFMKLAGKSSYAELHRWSVESSADFWELVWRFGQVRGDPGGRRLINPEQMPGASFFPEGKLNFAENLLRVRDATPAIVVLGRGPDQAPPVAARAATTSSRASHRRLRLPASSKGDRVAGYLPNMPEAIAAMLATR